MNIVSKFSFFLFLLSFVQSALLSAEEFLEVDLFGDVNTEITRLYWEVKGWPPDLIGFQVVKQDGDRWKPLGSDVIQPGVYRGRDWKAYGVTGELSTVLTAKLNKLTRDGATEQPVSAVVETLQERGGLGTGDRLAMKEDFVVAVASGFGLVDPSNSGADGRYRIYAVRSGTGVDPEPLSEFQTSEFGVNLGKAVRDLEANSSELIVNLSWSLPLETYKALGIFGYYVYRRQVGLTEWESLTSVPLWGDRVDHGFTFQFQDGVPQGGVDWEYGVEPVTMLQRILERKTVTVTCQEKFSPPQNLSLEQGDSYLYSLAWEIPQLEKLQEAVMFCQIERALYDSNSIKELGLEMMPPESAFKTVQSIKDISQSHWTDPLRTEDNISAFYRVRLVNSSSGVEAVSRSLYKSLRPNIPPPPVTELSAQVVPDEDEVGVKIRIQWKETAKDDDKVDYFRIFFGEEKGNLTHLASHRVKENFFEIEVGSGQKDYFIEVVPVGTNSLLGEASGASVYVPKIRLDPFPKDSAIQYTPHINKLESTIRWEYGDSTDLSGFRIRHLKTKEIIADTDEIGPDASEWVWRGEALQKERRISLEIEAVGVFDYITSSGKVAYLSNFPHTIRNYALPEVEFKETSIYQHNGDRFLVLKWEPWDEALYSEVERLAIGPVDSEEPDQVRVSYRIQWHHYIETENGKLVVKLPSDFKGEVPMRLIPLYLDEKGRPIIMGTFTGFTVNLDSAGEDTSELSDEEAPAKPRTPIGKAIHWETRLIEEEASFTDEFMAGVFAFRNVGSNPIKISKISSSCGCTTAKLDKTFYLPGEDGEILATFEFEGRTGRQTNVIDVYVEGYDEPVRLILRTTIPKVLSIKPAFHTWTSKDERSPRNSVIEVKVDAPVQILDVTSSDSRITTELESIEEGKRYRLKLSPESSEEKFNAILTVKTNYPENNPKSYPIKIQVR